MAPSVVQVRGGLYLGEVMAQRGSSATISGRPGVEQTATTQCSVPECTRAS